MDITLQVQIVSNHTHIQASTRAVKMKRDEVAQWLARVFLYYATFASY